MRVVVVGAGAIGGPIAAGLFECGASVVLVARGANFEAISKDGLTVATPERTSQSPVDVVNGIGSLVVDEGDVFFLCVKSQDTAAALAEMETVAPSTVAVFCAQNGVANERAVSVVFPRTYGVCVMSPASYLEPGHVEVFASPIAGVLDVGLWPTGQDGLATEVSTVLSRAGFESMVTSDIENLKWGKLLSNVMNALEVLCGPKAFDNELARRVRSEAVQCLNAHGVDVERATASARERARLIRYRPIKGVERVGSSSWQSMLRVTGSVEADYLNGEIVALGRRYDIATPANELVRRRANDMARSGVRPGTVRVEELLAQLEAS